MTREGNLEAPTRHPLLWQEESFYDEQALDEELRRVFDICHGCRRCFNLCDSFPRLFDLIDNSPSGELDTVSSKDFEPIIEACTLCDMCFMTKCPYVPPHEFDVDFPHLMLRQRAVNFKKKGAPLSVKILSETDTTGKIASTIPAVTNWVSSEQNHLTRPLMEATLNIDKKADLPKYCGKTLVQRFKKLKSTLQPNKQAPGFGKKVALYATCFGNYNYPQTGEAALKVLSHNGVNVDVVYEGCCGMPKLEHGDLPNVAKRADHISSHLKPWIEKGYTIVPLVPSCSLMFKSEWPLLLPDNASVSFLSRHTQDLSEYIVKLEKSHGLMQDLQPLPDKVAVHLACHARAQNIGPKAAELLRYIPNIDLSVIERCSGHGGSWGVMKDNFDVAMKIGKPVARKVDTSHAQHLVSECPLAGMHIAQGVASINQETEIKQSFHPIELLARSYNL